MALRKFSKADEGVVKCLFELTGGTWVGDAPVAAPTLTGKGGSARSLPLAAPASMTGTVAGVPAMELRSSGMASRARRVGRPSIFTSKQRRRVGAEWFQK